MHDGTMVFGSAVRRSEKWRVYRIRTANSTYELEVQAESADGARRCAVLTCVAPHPNAGHSFEDSAPRIGAESLYGASPVDWIGRRLAVGTAITSEIVSVDFVKTASAPTRSAKPQPEAPRAQPPAPPLAQEQQRHVWSPYPLGELEMLETAANALRAVCHQRTMLDDLARDPLLLKRYRLALGACGVMLEALEKRG